MPALEYRPSSASKIASSRAGAALEVLSKRFLIAPVGLPDVFDDWTSSAGFAGWEILLPRTAGLDSLRINRADLSRLLSLLGEQDVQIVCSGDSAHLGIRLLAGARKGVCVLLDPPVTSLLTLEETQTSAETGRSIGLSTTALEKPLQEMDLALSAGVSEDDRMRILISSLEEEVSDENPRAATIRSMLEAYRATLDQSEGAASTVAIDPWWTSCLSLSNGHRAMAWFPQKRQLPAAGLPLTDIRTTGWPIHWWEPSTTLDVASQVLDAVSQEP